VKAIFHRLRAIPQTVFFCGAALFVVTLFWAGSRPFAVGLFPEPYDKAVHFTAFAVLGSLLAFGARGRSPILLIFLTSLVGGADEFVQQFEPGRDSSFFDFLADVAGACVAIPLACRVLNAMSRGADSGLGELPPGD
jgi:hypothetical protein